MIPSEPILVVAPFFPHDAHDPLIGGFINNPAHLWAHIAQQGYNVQVLTYGRPKGTWHYNKVQVTSIGTIPFKGIPNTLVLEIKLLHALLKANLRSRYAQIRVHHVGGLGVILLRFLHLLHGPLTVTAHGTSVPDIAANQQAEKNTPPPSLCVRLSRWLQYQCEKQLYSRADTLVSPSRFQVKEMIKLYGVDKKRIIVIPNGYDEKHYQRDEVAAANLRTKLGINATEQIILMVGRPVPKKGFESFINAAHLYQAQNPETATRFICVIGDPLHRRGELDVDALAQKLPTSALLLRNVPEDELPAFYSAARLCVVPSIGYESVPSVVYEACACGCKVLASRLPGIKEVIDGQFIEDTNPAQLARRIAEVLTSDTPTHFTQDFSLHALAPRQLDLGTHNHE